MQVLCFTTLVGDLCMNKIKALRFFVVLNNAVRFCCDFHQSCDVLKCYQNYLYSFRSYDLFL